MHEIFGVKHLIILVICIVLIVFGFLFAKKMTFQNVCKTFFYGGIVSETIKIFYSKPLFSLTNQSNIWFKLDFFCGF